MESGKIDRYSTEEFQKAVGLIENLNDDAQLFLKSVLGVIAPQNYGIFWFESDITHTYITATSFSGFTANSASVDWLSSCPYLDFAPMQLENLSVDEIWNVIRTANIQEDTLPSMTTKNELIEWCKKNVADIERYLPNRSYVYVLFYQKVMFNVLTYLRRKFDWNTYFITESDHAKKVLYPCGAKFDEPLTSLFGDGVSPGKGTRLCCRFPDDEITELLTLYGHNRCLNGYKAVAE